MELLRAAEAAKVLNVHPGTLRNWRKSQKGPPFYKMASGAVRYDKKDLKGWIESQTRKVFDE